MSPNTRDALKVLLSVLSGAGRLLFVDLPRGVIALGRLFSSTSCCRELPCLVVLLLNFGVPLLLFFSSLNDGVELFAIDELLLFFLLIVELLPEFTAGALAGCFVSVLLARLFSD